MEPLVLSTVLVRQISSGVLVVGDFDVFPGLLQSLGGKHLISR